MARSGRSPLAGIKALAPPARAPLRELGATVSLRIPPGRARLRRSPLEPWRGCNAHLCGIAQVRRPLNAPLGRNQGACAAGPRPAAGAFAAPLGPRSPCASPREGAIATPAVRNSVGGVEP